MKKDLTSIMDLTIDDVDHLLNVAAELKQMQKQGIAHRPLEGKTLGMIFEKSSTRTRISFEVGMYQLGGHALFLSRDSIQLNRGESVADTARVMSRYLDIIMIRTYGQQIVEEMARHATIPLINGLSDLLHPCQVLSDIFTMVEVLGGYKGKTVAYLGDGNNLANSWLNAAARLPISLALACPLDHGPDEEILACAQKSASEKVVLTDDPVEAVKQADVIYTDVWISMGQEGKEAEKLNALKKYQVNQALVNQAKPGAMIMHCLPAHRGQEITDEVIDGQNSIVFDQAENRLHMQKAIMRELLWKRGEK
jgi:ornithine carbamoyltransferase